MNTIPVQNVRIGMYVCGLDTSWLETPFLLQGFFIESEEQIRQLKQCCEYVQIDEHQSLKLRKPKTLAESHGITRLSEDDRPFFNHSSEPQQPELAVYQPEQIVAFFRNFGTLETVVRGTVILSEGQKAKGLLGRNKMYLLLKGQVLVFSASRKIGTIGAGEIFGELTPLSLCARSASVIAGDTCELIGLDDMQLLAGLKQTPEFALVLMGLLIKRLRQAAADAKQSRMLAAGKSAKGMRVFNRPLLRELLKRLGRDSLSHMLAGQTIFRQGGGGIVMYVILEGQVVVSIDGTPVESSGPGCVIGEVTLLDKKQRMARAIAETDCSLLRIDGNSVVDLVKSQPEFGLSLLRALAIRLRYFRIGCAAHTD